MIRVISVNKKDVA